eukprot:Tbor_TRINITY_DN5101_c3_g1::TRINITY_DN5101_c3_g1_i1::g.25990::m.25990
MFPFPEIYSISELYDYDKYDDMLGYGKQGSVYRGRVLPAACGVSKNLNISGTSIVTRTPLTSLTPGQSVAIKVIKKSCLVSEKDINGVINEVEMLKLLDHPNCVKFYEPLQCTMSVYLVMELITNSNELFTLIDKGYLIHKEALVREITKQMLSGLIYLHRTLHIVHRDMKPENILVCLGNEESGMTTMSKNTIPNEYSSDNNFAANNINEKGKISRIRVVIVDFGFAKYLGSSSDGNFPKSPSLFVVTSTAAQNSTVAGNKGTVSPFTRPRISSFDDYDKGSRPRTALHAHGNVLSNFATSMPSNSMNSSKLSRPDNTSSHQSQLPKNYPKSNSSDSLDRHYNSPLVSTPCGTFAYLAPETVRGIVHNGDFPIETTKGAILQTDLFALGVILHVMLTGKLPFNSTKNKFQLIRQYEEGVQLDGDVWKSLSKESREFVSILLSYDARRRPNAKAASMHPWFTATLQISSNPSLSSSSTVSSTNNNITNKQGDTFPSGGECGTEGKEMDNPLGYCNSEVCNTNTTSCESVETQTKESIPDVLCSNSSNNHNYSNNKCSDLLDVRYCDSIYTSDASVTKTPVIQCPDSITSVGDDNSKDSKLPTESMHTTSYFHRGYPLEKLSLAVPSGEIGCGVIGEEKRLSTCEMSDTSISSGRCCSRESSIGSAGTSHGSALDSDGSAGVPPKHHIISRQSETGCGMIKSSKDINKILDLLQAHQSGGLWESDEEEYCYDYQECNEYENCCEDNVSDLDDNDAPQHQLSRFRDSKGLCHHIVDSCVHNTSCDDDNDSSVDDHCNDKEHGFPHFKRYMTKSNGDGGRVFENCDDNSNNNSMYGHFSGGREVCGGPMITMEHNPRNRRSTSPNPTQICTNNLYINATFQSRRDDDIFLSSPSNPNGSGGHPYSRG